MEPIPAVDFTLRSTRKALLISGVIIDESKSYYTLKLAFGYVLFYLNAFWLHSDISAEINWLIEGIQLGKNIIQLSLVAPCSLLSIMATVKAIFLFYGKQKILRAVQTLRKLQPNFDVDLTSESRPKQIIIKKQHSICKESAKLLQFVNSTFFVVTFTTLISFSTLPCLSMYFGYKKTGEITWKLPFPVKYFFDPFIKPVYYFVYCHQVISTAIVVANLCACETLFYFFSTYLQMHFRLLGVEIEHVTDSGNNEDVHKKLVDMVHKHHSLIQLTKSVEELYSKSTLFNIILSSVLICLSGFNITFNDDTEAVFSYITFLALSFSQISMLCYFGDMIMHASMDVSNAVYRSRWYECDQKCRRILFLILLRAQKPCKLTAANFADINLKAFTTILSRSWSYFAVLKTMYK